MGRHRKDTLANMEVVASAIIDDRCRKADLETDKYDRMGSDDDKRRGSPAMYSSRDIQKKGFWNEAGRGSREFETPKCVVRYSDTDRWRSLTKETKTGYKCMDVTVDSDSLDHLITHGMVTTRDRDQVERDHGRHLSSVGKRHALAEMILFNEGTSNVKACVHMATDRVQKFNQVDNPDIHTEDEGCDDSGFDCGLRTSHHSSQETRYTGLARLRRSTTNTRRAGKRTSPSCLLKVSWESRSLN